jgi:hypothetical protein
MGSDWASSMPSAYQESTAMNAKEIAMDMRRDMASLAVICERLRGCI